MTVKNLIFLGMLIAGLVAAGVIHINQQNNNVEVTIDKQKLEQTAEKTIKVGSQLVHEFEASLEQASKNAEQPQNGTK
jgi:nucleoside recognition membrane protein YjiH